MIKINGELWRVRIVPPQHPALYRNGNPALGCCDDIVKTIFISNVLTQREMKKVLCHEMVHAAMYSYDVPITDYVEEIVADLIATYGNEIMSLTHMTYDKMLGYK
jgi:hypothetical protein